MIQDWANDNAGSIELTGHLAAVGQRHLAIQNQIQQIAALQSLAEAQKRQQMENALLEERQNILYDISASLDDIKRLFDREPARAYYEFLVLDEFVAPLGLEHRLFPSLEWKNHCNKTIAGISELHSWCNTSLDEKYRRAGTNALAQRNLRAAMLQKIEEDRKRLEAEEAENRRILARQEAVRKTLKRAKVAFSCSVLGLVCLLVLLLHFRKSDSHSVTTALPGVFVLGFAGVCGFFCAVYSGTSIMDVLNELPTADKPIAKRLAVRGFAVAFLAGMALFVAFLFGSS